MVKLADRITNPQPPPGNWDTGIALAQRINPIGGVEIMMESQSGGIVYVLTNPAMPGIVKVGKTARENVATQLNELYSTGVPVPFECEYAARVEDETDVEKAFHIAFSPYRINPRRGFFQIEPEQAIALLKVMAVEDVTPSLQAEAEKVDIGAREGARRLKTRRPNLNFVEMGIPVEAELQFHRDRKTVGGR